MLTAKQYEVALAAIMSVLDGSCDFEEDEIVLYHDCGMHYTKQELRDAHKSIEDEFTKEYPCETCVCNTCSACVDCHGCKDRDNKNKYCKGEK